MTKQNRLKRILQALTPDKTAIDFAEIDNQLAKLKDALKEKVQAQTILDMQLGFEKFKKKIDIKPLFEAVENLEEALDRKIKGISGEMEANVGMLQKLMSDNEQASDEQLASIASSIDLFKNQIALLTDQKNNDVKSLKDKISQLYDFSNGAQTNFLQLEKSINEIKNDKSLSNRIDEFNDLIEKLRRELTNRINNIHSGGNMNRQINVNSSVMSQKYTDINFKSNTAIRFIATNDEVNKRVDIVASLIAGGASGGGGGGSILGSDKQLLFFDGDNNPAGASVLTWDKNNSVLAAQGDITSTKAITATQAVTGSDILVTSGGSASDPSFRTTGDPELGIYMSGSNTIGLVQGGNTMGLFNNSGLQVKGYVRPATSGGDLGDATHRWGNLTQITGAGIIWPDYNITHSASIVTFSGPINISGGTSGVVKIQTASVAGNWALTLPPNDGSANQVLTTDGNGITSWASVASGSGTPGGADTQVQFNDGGSFGGSSTFTWNKNSSVLEAQYTYTRYLQVRDAAPFVDLYDTDVNDFAGLDMRGTTALRIYAPSGAKIRMMNDLDIQGVFVSGAIVPDLDDGYDLGDETHAFAGLYLGPNENIHFNNTPVLFQKPVVKHTALSALEGSRVVFQDPTTSLLALVNTASIATSSKLFGFPNQSGGLVATPDPGANTIYMWDDTDKLPVNATLGTGLTYDHASHTLNASVAGGGTAITRLVSIVTANTTGGTAALTDYVYFANDGIKFTLPTAINNSNLYTVKNHSASSVLVVTSNGQSIDGSDTALMPTNNESLSFVSNGSVWGVV